MGGESEHQTRQHSWDGISLQVWIVTAVLAVTALFLAMAAFLAWHTARVPFPGVFTEPTLVVNETGDQTWPGYTAGLLKTMKRPHREPPEGLGN